MVLGLDTLVVSTANSWVHYATEDFLSRDTQPLLSSTGNPGCGILIFLDQLL